MMVHALLFFCTGAIAMVVKTNKPPFHKQRTIRVLTLVDTAKPCVALNIIEDASRRHITILNHSIKQGFQ
jgi:hypothetical protein